LAFKEFVLSAVDRREASNDTLKMLRELAVEGRYEKEFDEVNAKVKIYSAREDNFCSTIEDWYENQDKYDKVIYISNRGITNLFKNTDGKAPKELIMMDCENVEFAKSVDMDRFVLINVEKVNLASMSKLPKNVELSDCGVVDFSYTDLSMSNILFKNCRSVAFIYATKFPAVLDLSEVDEVDLSYCDLKDVKEIKFKKGAKVNLKGVKNLSPSLDLSGPCEIDISGVDVSFIESDSIWGSYTHNGDTKLPKKVSFRGEQVNIYKSNIEKCEEVVFGPKVKKVVFDLSGLSFMDSTGIGLLIGRYKKLKQLNIPSYISGASVSTEKVIELAGLYSIMPKY
jgi:stage II sporulation protein AA (anti-sigma F factor antagonist)